MSWARKNRRIVSLKSSAELVINFLASSFVPVPHLPSPFERPADVLPAGNHNNLSQGPNFRHH